MKQSNKLYRGIETSEEVKVSNDEYFTVKKTADRLGLSQKTIRRWIKDRKIVASRPDNRSYLVNWKSVIEMLKENEAA